MSAVASVVEPACSQMTELGQVIRSKEYCLARNRFPFLAWLLAVSTHTTSLALCLPTLLPHSTSESAAAKQEFS